MINKTENSVSEPCYNPSENDYYTEVGMHTDALLKRVARCRTIWSMAERERTRYGQRGKWYE